MERKNNNRARRNKKVQPAEKPKPKAVNSTSPPPRKKKVATEDAKAIVANAVQKKYHGRGFDIRTKSLSRFVCADNPAGHNTVLDVEVNPVIASIQGVVIGFVGQLRAAGFGSAADQESYPYFLTVYLYQMLIKAMNQELVPTVNVPLCLLNLLQALQPKVVGYKVGKISFKWNISNVPPTLPPVLAFGSVPYNMGITGPEQTWSIGYATIEAPDAYSDDKGNEAYTQMLAFLKIVDDKNPMHELVAQTHKSYSMNDCSAFSQTFPEVGQAFGVGAYTTEVFNAVKIRSPIYAVFADYTQDNVTVAQARVSSGSPRFLGSRLVSMAQESRLANKFKTIFKPIDFNDLWFALNYMVGTALEYISTSNLTNQPSLVLQCPLSAKEAALILRASLASLNNVAVGSDLELPDFTPLQFPYAAMNVSSAIKMWQVPYVFSENIRSLAMVAAGMPDEKSSQQFVYCPVYGVYEQLEDYNFTWGDSGAKIYADGSETEPTFSMVSLSVSATQYICPVGTQLANAITVWNNWIGQFQSVLQTTTFSSGTNNSSLYSILTTRYTQLAPPVQINTQPQKGSTTLPGQPKSRSTSKKFVPRYESLLKQVKAVNPVTLLDEQELSISSNVPILNEPFQLTNLWVLPKWRLQETTSLNYLSKYYAQNYENFYVQMAPSKDANGAFTYVSLKDKFTSLGQIAANGPSSAPNALLQTMRAAEEKGEGGFFGQILADFAATQFNLPFLSQLGALVPF